MNVSCFTSEEIIAIRRSFDFLEYELEDSALRPSGWTHKRYSEVFRSSLKKISCKDETDLSDDEVSFLSFALRVYIETKETHGITRSVPESFEEAVAARKRILSHLYA